MASTVTALTDRQRAEVERLLRRAVEEEVRRSDGRIDGRQLIHRARSSLLEILRPAQEEYHVYQRAERESAPRRLADRFGRRSMTGAIAAAVAASVAALLLLGGGESSSAAAFGGAAVVALAALAGFILAGVLSHVWSAQRQAGTRHQPGGVDQLRLAWLTAVEVRGIRPYLDQQRAVALRRDPLPSGKRETARRTHSRPKDRSSAARARTALTKSFDQLPERAEPLIGRHAELSRISQWVNRDRARADTRPTVVVLHGPAGAGRTTLAGHAAYELRELFRGACLVDLRGQSQDPLPTRDALLHLMNRLGAPQDQLLFRDGTASREQDTAGEEAGLRRLTEHYRRHLTGLPVIIILDDATDPEQVRTLIPERSDSLVLVTASQPLRLDPDLPASVHQLAVGGLEAAPAEQLLRSLATAGGSHQGAGSLSPGSGPGPYDEHAWRKIVELCEGRPLLLRLAGAALDQRTPATLADDLDIYGPSATGLDAADRVLRMRYADQPEDIRRLLRRLAIAGRASLGASAAAALLDVGQEEGARRLNELTEAGLVHRVRGSRYRLHDLVRRFARARLVDEESEEERAAAEERLIRAYAELADTVIRLVDGKTSTRADVLPAAAGEHGFTSVDAALRWLDDESSFITATLRYAGGQVDRRVVLDLLGALCDYCLLRGDLYRLGELNDLTQAVGQGLLSRSVQWRTGVAARQLGDLDKARRTLSSVVSLYQEAQHGAGTARALRDLGITLQQQGQLREASGKLREALELQQGERLAGDRAWTLHALATVERECGRLGVARGMLADALTLHRASGSVHGEAWTRYQLGQALLSGGETAEAERELRAALHLYGQSSDPRGQAWALTDLGRVRLHETEATAAAEQLRSALSQHRDNEDARGEAWTLYYLGHALEEGGDGNRAVQTLERARTMFSRMRDTYGLACARHHCARVTRDLRAQSTGNLRNSGFARQLLVDARRDFQRAGVAHGEAWSALELAVIDAGNERLPQALELAGEALALFTEGYGEGVPDARGADWAAFLRCTLLPLASPGGSEVGVAVAQEELAQLLSSRHPLRDPSVTDAAHSYAVMLERGQGPAEGWSAWRLGMVPGRGARDVLSLATGTG